SLIITAKYTKKGVEKIRFLLLFITIHKQFITEKTFSAPSFLVVSLLRNWWSICSGIRWSI
ncbi:hypothetical protein, partial [Flavobacterium soyangense]|uniref:hypothetical protein n=1 Tax=Flavobacterium soyangense TaxID=2023265 RepID=UPI001E4E1069